MNVLSTDGFQWGAVVNVKVNVRFCQNMVKFLTR